MKKFRKFMTKGPDVGVETADRVATVSFAIHTRTKKHAHHTLHYLQMSLERRNHIVECPALIVSTPGIFSTACFAPQSRCCKIRAQINESESHKYLQGRFLETKVFPRAMVAHLTLKFLIFIMETGHVIPYWYVFKKKYST